ncbi:MAG: phosphatidate cytidylyltransferase [Alphaproteobacteria bacterium]|nr:phosphatidate cytidylyltransferase [Alphaproteobacteria bacterium]
MLQRIIAALVGLGIIVPAIVLGGMIGANIVAGIALLIAMDEYTRMAVPEHNLKALAAMVLAGGAVYASILFGPAGMAVWVLALAAILMFVGSMLLVPDTAAGQQAATRLAAGLLYVPVMFSFVIQVRRLEDGLAWLFLTLCITWAGDTGAYFAGRAFGKHKLFERVSPKKTWEGFFGGMVASVIFAGVFKQFFLPQLGWHHVVLLGVVLDIVGVVGDLVESMFKRAFGVKDSGWIMPGHGGILDRIDSLLFTAPVAWVIATQLGLG